MSKPSTPACAANRNEHRRRFLLRTFPASILAAGCIAGSPKAIVANVGPPKPYGPTPSARQLRWHEMEFYGFIQVQSSRSSSTYSFGVHPHPIFEFLCKASEACLFSDAGPDVRWVGNERGIAGDPLWSTLNKDDFAPGRADEARLNRGDRPGSHWVPAECDVSIRPGWFYHPKEDSQVKSGATLVRCVFVSPRRRFVRPSLRGHFSQAAKR